jgi:hypothetical protein
MTNPIPTSDKQPCIIVRNLHRKPRENDPYAVAPVIWMKILGTPHKVAFHTLTKQVIPFERPDLKIVNSTSH